MHIHLGLLHGLVAFCGVLIYGFAWRVIAAHNSQNSVGQAMSFIY